MTSNLPILVERVLDLTRQGAVVDERLETLIVRGPLPSAAAHDDWIRLASNPPAPITAVQVYDPQIGGDLVDGDHFDPDRVLHITLTKPPINGVALLFFQESLAAFLSNPTLHSSVLIADLDDSEGFKTRGLEIGRWDFSTTPLPTTHEALPVDPTRFVRDFVPAREVPTDLNPWILLAPPARASASFQAWERFSARRLLSGLVSRTWLDDGEVWFQASGPPIFRIKADDPDLPPNRARLHDAAVWVFLSGSDVEARHLIFATELARAHRMNLGLDAVLDRALEAAKVTYEAHVQSSSRETLKALADLRKTVIEETQKITQRAQDLTSTLWRDVAVSVAPFVLKIVGDIGKLQSQKLAAYFYFAAAGFIALSFFLQCRINAAFFATQRSSRQRWMQTLYSYISAQERKEIAEKPIDDALDNYSETRNVLTLVYGLLVAILLYFGISVLDEVPPPPQASSPSAAAPTVTNPNAAATVPLSPPHHPSPP